MKPACLSPTCLYFGFDGLERVCLHPRDPKRLRVGKARCECHVDFDVKLSPVMERSWPQRLTLDQFRKVPGNEPA